MYLGYISKLIQFKQQEKYYRECLNTANVVHQATAVAWLTTFAGMLKTFAANVEDVRGPCFDA